ncbi:MAG: TetR/AcrR family transcriptional regulator [Angelakisella sp.]
MGRKPLSKEQRERTRQQLFEASNRMIAEHGIERLSIRTLCNEVGITYSSFYDYYKNKDDLIASKLGALDSYFVAHEDELLRNEDAITNIKNYIQLYSDFSSERNLDIIREVYRLQMYRIILNTQNPHRPLYTILHRILLEGLEKNQLRDDISIEETTRIILSFCKGIVIEWCICDGSYPLSEFSATAAAVFSASFCKQQGSLSH